ncbi:MAG TPA: trypsin-like peptidase domain-containing protein [Bacteroidia bacterium]|nr:trypsin-like peptidase domain-containing protein [Bacteroidia bacterium]
MNIKLLPLFLLLFPALGFCQKQEKIYYDVEHKGTRDSSNASYYRIADFNSNGEPIDSVKDYYMTGEIRGRGIAIKIDRTDDSATKWKGQRITYYKNGRIKGLHNFNKYGKPDSTNISYYESGMLQNEINFKNGVVVGKFYKEWNEYGAGVKVFADHFHNGNAYDWPLNCNERHICKIIADSGLYMASLTDDKPVAQAINLPLDLDRTYEIATVVDFKGGDKSLLHGLIWGFADWNNYNFFFISADGYYKVGTIREGILEYAMRDMYSDLIRKGMARNVLKIISTRRSGTEYTINGRKVCYTKVSVLRGNFTGFMVEKGIQQNLFEHLLVKQNLDTNENQPDSSKMTQVPGSYPGNPNGNEFKGWRGEGSGFFVDPNGYIVTNYHVVKEATAIEVDAIQGGDRVFLKAVVISVDKDNDLAVIKITDDKFKPYSSLPYSLKTETSDVATDVFTLGFPQADILGVEVKFTDGKISAKTGFKGNPAWYQVSVPLQHGNSGGPLFDYDGNIVGIVNAGVVQDQNVNYAIKASYMKSFLESLTERFVLPNDTSLANKPLTEKIKALSNYVVMIKVK